jgi:hypothetical protein
MLRGSQSLANTVSESNKKLFGVGLHAMNEMHVRFPELEPKDMRVVWFGAGLQGQLPVLFGMYPDVEFEIHTQRECPVSTDLRSSLKVTYHKTSLDECLRQVEDYDGDKKYAVLLDLDYHIKPSELTAMNRARVVPTVESESVHYDRYTAQYNAACARVARCGHVVLVSTPFRMPWVTSDFASNAQKASWLDPQLREHEMRCPSMQLCPQFGSRLRSTELRGLLVTGGASLESVINWKELDASLHGTATATRELSRANFMLEQLQTYKAVADARGTSASAGNECLRGWSQTFVDNSIDEMRQTVRRLESTNRRDGIYKA